MTELNPNMEVNSSNESKRIRRVLTFIGYNFFDSNSGQKVNLSFVDKNPFKYNGERSFTFTMTKAWLDQLLNYSHANLALGCKYDVLTRYNFEFKTDYICGIYVHDDNPQLPQFNAEVISHD